MLLLNRLNLPKFGKTNSSHFHKSYAVYAPKLIVFFHQISLLLQSTTIYKVFFICNLRTDQQSRHVGILVQIVLGALMLTFVDFHCL